MYSLKKWKYLLKCFLYILKVQWVQKNWGLTFLMVPPNDEFALQLVHLGGNQSCQQMGGSNYIEDKH